MSLTLGGAATADLQPIIEDFRRQLAIAEVERGEPQHCSTERTVQRNEIEAPKAALTDASAPPSRPIYRSSRDRKSSGGHRPAN